jgi:general secretion pathway protein A
MYQSFFGLAEAPFSIAPDPRYLYMSRSHQEALAHLLYGLRGEGGFVLLTGEVGTGKTTICRALLEQIPASCDVAYIFNPRLTVLELLSTICREFGIACPETNASVMVFVDRINAYLLERHANGRNTVLIIDEAQNLSVDVLEQMRLLTNLETSQRKLLQIILLGQPELAEMLARPELRQLAQRIVARYHLGPLPKAEVERYIRHRLDVSGARQNLIPSRLMARLHRLSGGVPRVLNVLCDRALLGAYAQGKEQVDRATLDKAAREVFGGPPKTRRRAVQVIAAALTLVTGATVAVAVYQHQLGNEATPAPSYRADASLSRGVEANAGSPAPDPETLEWMPDKALAHSKAIAFATLLHAWGETEAGATPCEPNGSSTLRCRIARGDLDELRRLNRPAILEMRDAQDRPFFACQTHLDERSATFTFGAATRRVSLGAVASQWSGHYIAMWRMPPEVGSLIRPGERGPAVVWLRRQLVQAGMDGMNPSNDPVFDDTMVHKVKQYQLKHGLLADGAIGTQTLMHLAGVTDQAGPTLQRKSGAP